MRRWTRRPSPTILTTTTCTKRATATRSTHRRSAWPPRGAAQAERDRRADDRPRVRALAKFPDANKAALGAEKVRERRARRIAAPAACGRRRPAAHTPPARSHPPSTTLCRRGTRSADPRRPPQARVARQVAAQRRRDRAGFVEDDGGARRHRRRRLRQGADGERRQRADAPRAIPPHERQHTTDHRPRQWRLPTPTSACLAPYRNRWTRGVMM